MSTSLTDTFSKNDSVTLSPQFGRADEVRIVTVFGRSTGGENINVVPRAAFLDAVRAECDVIIVDKADLPEVEGDGDECRVGGDRFTDLTADTARRWARKYLALAEHLDANPEPDPEQVSALSTLVTSAIDAGLNPSNPDCSFERWLVQRGVTVKDGAL